MLEGARPVVKPVSQMEKLRLLNAALSGPRVGPATTMREGILHQHILQSKVTLPRKP